ncbi:MAG TPA: NAD-dependent epimerase/dehydratase family protein [Candidatus Atribacteria bacterium]|nr:NAD-dependent epimerase/dehydratase family protein [Candidatus Atribacteria bacterium]
MKNILLTGIAGFIGTFTAKRLIEEGYSVIGIDNLNTYYDPLLKQKRLEWIGKNKNVEFIKGDIEDFEFLGKIFSQYKLCAIVNLAARAGVRYSMENPFVYERTNTLGTLNLLEMAKRNNVSKFVLASTSSLYAGEEMPFSESLSVNRPISVYAATKKGAEAISYSYHYLYGIDVTIFRYFTVYGPFGRPDMSIFRFIKWIDEGSPLILYGDGSQMRDFTYVDDIAKGTVLGLKSLGYEIINLGGNKPYKLSYMIKLIEENLGKEAKIEQKPFHKADLKATWANIEKARELLGWEPSISLEEGIKRTVRWYLKNRDWIKNVSIEEGDIKNS